MMKINKNLPNYITCLRIFGTGFLLFTESLSTLFFITYIFTGVTDVLDGFLARLTHTTSEFGARLDSVADLLFYTVLLAKIFPNMWETLPHMIWFVVGSIIVLRVVSYLVAFAKHHRLASLHTYMNKITGFSIFLYPFFLSTSMAVPAAFLVCAITAVASIEELLIHLFRSRYEGNAKTILLMR